MNLAEKVLVTQSATTVYFALVASNPHFPHTYPVITHMNTKSLRKLQKGEAGKGGTGTSTPFYQIFES